MIYDYSHSDGQRFIVQTEDYEPNVVRVLGNGESYPVARSYLEKGVDVQVGTPVLSGVSVPGMTNMSQGFIETFMKSIDSLYPENGGWRDITDQDLAVMQMKYLILEYGSNSEDEVVEVVEHLYKEFFPDLRRFVSPMIKSDCLSAMIVCLIGDPRWFASPEGDKYDSLFGYFDLEDSNIFSDHSTTWVAVNVALCHSIKAWRSNSNLPKTPFHRYMELNVKAAIEEESNFDFSKHLSISAVSAAVAMHKAMKMLLAYIYEIWFSLVTDSSFDATDFFKDEEDVEFFYTHI